MELIIYFKDESRDEAIHYDVVSYSIIGSSFLEIVHTNEVVGYNIDEISTYIEAMNRCDI